MEDKTSSISTFVTGSDIVYPAYASEQQFSLPRRFKQPIVGI